MKIRLTPRRWEAAIWGFPRHIPTFNELQISLFKEAGVHCGDGNKGTDVG